MKTFGEVNQKLPSDARQTDVRVCFSLLIIETT